MRDNHERKSLIYQNDGPAAISEFKRDSAPFTVQKMRIQQNEELASSPKHTQMETVDTIKQQLSTQDEE